MEKHYLTKNIEKMINPLDVGTISFMQSYAKSIPLGIQKKMIKDGAKKTPYMGFVVEPYSFFLCYELKDLDKAKTLIPDNYTLIKTKIFEDDIPKYYAIFGCFNVHTSAFWGTRIEFYIIAENNDTGLLTWVIIDYHTNTIGFDAKNGLCDGNTSSCIFTTNFDGEIIADIRGKDNNTQLVFESTLKNGVENKLCQRLWFEGNLSITYGRELSNNKGEPFGVSFDPKEVQKAMRIPVGDVQIKINTWFPGLFNSTPDIVACFPFAQHLLSDSPGHHSSINNEQELVDFVNKLDFDKVPPYSSKSLKKSFQVGQLISFAVIIILIVLLIFK